MAAAAPKSFPGRIPGLISSPAQAVLADGKLSPPIPSAPPSCSEACWPSTRNRWSRPALCPAEESYALSVVPFGAHF